MKKLIYSSIFCLSLASCDVLHTVAKDVLSIPTTEEAAGGLKDALKQGFSKGSDLLSVRGAFGKNNLIKILLPTEAQTVANKLSDIGMEKQVNNVIEKLNDGAEDAVGTAKPIFVSAITNMSFTDAMGILTGGKGSATKYLKETTTNSLIASFSPKIQSALDQVGVTRNWSDLVNTYNMIPFIKKMNPDLNAHVTEKALFTLFNKVEEEENKIRENPLLRSTDLMKKAFAYADSQIKK
jgi:hypothetical protein